MSPTSERVHSNIVSANYEETTGHWLPVRRQALTHHSAQEHGLGRVKAGILHQRYLIHDGFHVIHLRAKQHASPVVRKQDGCQVK